MNEVFSSKNCEIAPAGPQGLSTFYTVVVPLARYLPGSMGGRPMVVAFGGHVFSGDSTTAAGLKGPKEQPEGGEKLPNVHLGFSTFFDV